jgi:hypothetical protein
VHNAGEEEHARNGENYYFTAVDFGPIVECQIKVSRRESAERKVVNQTYQAAVERVDF